MIPENYILEDNIAMMVGGKTLRYRIRYSIFGEVLTVEVPFLKLPPAARKMTVEGDLKAYEKQLANHAQLLKYKLPLAVLGFWKGNEFKAIQERIQEREASLEQESETPMYLLDMIADDWTRHCYFKMKKDFDERHTTDFWNRLCDLVGGKSMDSRELGDLRNDGYELVNEVVATLLPLTDDKSNFGALAISVKHLPHPDSIAFLLAELQQHGTNHFAFTAVCEGLYVVEAPEVLATFKQLYEENKSKDSYVLHAILKNLFRFETKVVLDIAWEVLLHSPFQFSRMAFNYLKIHGVAETKIGAVLTFAIQDDRNENKNNLIDISKLLQNDGDLLPVMAYIRSTCDSVQAGYALGIDSGVGSLVCRLWNNSLPRKIIELLYSSDERVRSLGLTLIQKVYTKLNRPDKVFPLSEDTIWRILTMIRNGGNQEGLHALPLLGVLSHYYDGREWISLLLQSEYADTKEGIGAILSLHKNGLRNVAVIPYVHRKFGNPHTAWRQLGKTTMLMLVQILLYYIRYPEALKVIELIRLSISDPEILRLIKMGNLGVTEDYTIRRKPL